ncbi:hypothetical protein JKF63_02480 [Porcisia hertigi]|uniref:Uncharacterized protein n=1 Tax=Porcisia hertigi TaxID=2761500 RepID=A0A836HRA5_9TRYP|nr:hypothetical protein JKF63_02480 [Porcisia hertigi]
MHSTTPLAGCLIVEHRQNDLQREIEAREFELDQLYKRRRHLTTSMCHGPAPHRLLVSTDPVPHLRIRGSPAQLQHPHPVVPPTPPLGDIGPVDSITFAITSERRRLCSRLSPQISGSHTVVLVTHSKALQKRPPPSEEFTTRLARLNKACALNAPSPLSVEAAAHHQHESNTTLLVSPIVAGWADGQSDESVASNLSSISAILGCCGEVRSLSYDEMEGARHVRFSSRSPQVTTFSVERSGAPLQELFSEEAAVSTELTEKPSIDIEKRFPSTELMLVQQEPSGHCDSTAPTGSTPAMSPRATAGDFTASSPQAGARKGWKLFKEHRSSLRERPPDARRSAHHFNSDAHNVAVEVRCMNSAQEKPQMTSEQVRDELDDRAGPMTPLKQCSEEGARELGELLGATSVSGDSISKSGAPHSVLRFVQPVTDTASLPQVFEGFADNSPIFLRRPERKPELPTQDSGMPPVLSQVTSQPPKAVAPLPRRSRASGKEEASAGNAAKKKKRVRFRESVEHADKRAAKEGCRRRRPERRSAHCRASASAVSGVPRMMPAELCFEQEGFCAGILLACGPTLFFD